MVNCVCTNYRRRSRETKFAEKFSTASTYTVNYFVVIYALFLHFIRLVIFLSMLHTQLPSILTTVHAACLLFTQSACIAYSNRANDDKSL